jgi:hypothetical protein
VVLANVFVQRFRQQQRLGSIGTGDVRYNPDSDTSCIDSESVRGEISHGLQQFFTKIGPLIKGLFRCTKLDLARVFKQEG